MAIYNEDKRQRVTVIATYEIPFGSVAYADFRRQADLNCRALEEMMGTDCVLEYSAIERKRVDTMVK